MKLPTIEQVEKAIKIPVIRWEGNCSGIAQGLLNAGLVKGKFCYGVWWGPISDKSSFRGRPFTHHAWIELKDGKVVDPTRWAFEGIKPYIYIGISGKEYDKGGNRLREKYMRPCPEYDPIDKKIPIKFSPQLKTLVLELLNQPPVFTARQLSWLASLPTDYLEPYTRDVYEALIKVGLTCLIPIDNRRDILGNRGQYKNSDKNMARTG